MENEDYKVIEHRETIFQVFRDGRIFRVKKSGIKQIPLTPHLEGGSKKYYLRIRIKDKDIKAHRLLAKAFLGLDIENKLQLIDHLDGNGLNNSFENLRVATSQDNARNMKGTRGISQNSNRFKTSIMNNEGKRLYKTSKDKEIVMSWRREKEIEFGYLTRASGILRIQ